MKNYLLVNRALAAEKNFNFFNNLFSRVKEHSSPTVKADGGQTCDGQSQRHYTLGLMKYAAMITLLLTFACGNVWATDFTITLDQFRTKPISGLVKIDNSNLSLSGGSLQLSSGNQNFTVSTTNSNYKIKRIVFTATKAVISYGGDAISESTFSPASPGTSFTLNLAASGGTAKITSMAVTLTTTTSETLEALVATALSDGVYTTGSSNITLSTVNGGGSFSTAGQEYITMSKSSGVRSLTVATSSSYNIKFVALAFYDEIFAGTISASTGTYTAASYLWTPGATPTNSVTLTFDTNDKGTKIRRVIVGYESAATKDYTVTAATSTGTNTYGTVAAGASSLDEDETTTITATPATGYQVTNWAVSGTGASISPDGASNSNTTTLTMGTANATVTATFGLIDYTVTKTLTNCAVKDGSTAIPSTMNYGDDLSTTIEPTSGNLLPSSITVSGVTSYTWNALTGALTLTDVTGNVSISISAAAPQTGSGASVTYALVTSGSTAATYSTGVFSNILSGGSSNKNTLVASNTLSGGNGVGVQSNKTTPNNSRTAGITSSTAAFSAGSSPYAEFTFDVVDGYTFTPTAISVPVMPISNDAYFTAIVTDGSSTWTSATSSCTQGAQATINATPSGGSALTGTVNIRVFCHNQSTSAAGFRFGTGSVTITGTVASAAVCPSAYSFHYGTNEQSDWTIACFEDGAETDERVIENFTIPTVPDFYVGWEGNALANDMTVLHSWNDNVSDLGNGVMNGAMVLLPVQGTSKVGWAQGAVGTLRCWYGSTSKNQYVGFQPNGYAIMYGGNNYAFAETATEHQMETEVVTLPAVSTTYQMGIATADGYTTCAHSNAAEAISNMGVTVKDGGKKKILFNPAIGDGDGYVTDDAKIAVYDVTNSTWDADFMSDADGDGIYEGHVADDCETIIIARFNKTKTSTGNWDDKYNQTNDYSISGDLQKIYKIDSWCTGDNCKETISSTTTSAHPATGQKGKFRMWANSNDQNWYVHWIPYYVLTYDANGGSGTTTQTERSSENSTLTVSTASNGFTAPTGYTFAGWATSDDRADAGTVDYAAGASYTLTANATLYAVWEAKEYTITLDDESATTSVSPSSVTATYNSSTIASITNPVKTGYTFGGWYSGDDGTGSLIIDTNGDLQANTAYTGAGGIWTNDDDVTLHAKWTVKQTTITIDDNDEYHGSTTPGTVTATFGSVLPSFTAASGESGYSLTGYYTLATSGTKIINADGTLVRNTTYSTDESTSKWNSEAASLTLYPQYEEDAVLTAMSADVLYTAADMANNSGSWGTESDTWFAGLSTNNLFETYGNGTSTSAKGATISSTNVTDDISKKSFTSVVYIMAADNTSSTSDPTKGAIELITPSTSGILYIYLNDNASNLTLKKKGTSTSTSLSGAKYKAMTVDASTHYFIQGAGSKRGIYGVQYVSTYSVSITNTNLTKVTGSTGTGAATKGKAYTATFTANTGYTLPSDVTLTIGGESQTKGTGYTWTISDGTATLTVPAAYVTGNIVVSVAGVAADTYNITYHCNSATSGCPSNDNSYALPNPLSTPSKTGYTFGGWFTDEDLTIAAVAGATLDADVDLYAKWCTNHTITWVVNGETYTTGTPTTSTNECAGVTTMPTAPADDVLDGCANSFRGWSATNLYGEATTTQPADLFVTAANAPTINADKTFYAVFGTSTSAPQVGTVLWSEDWTGATNNTAPTSPSASGSTKYGDATIEYEWGNGKDSGGTDSNVSKVTTSSIGAGGVSPEAFIGGKDGDSGTSGYLTISGIPKGKAKKVTVEYRTNNQRLEVSVSGTGYSGSNSTKSLGLQSFDVTCGSAETFSLTFTATTTSNVRLDNIVVKIKEDGATNYRCLCPTWDVEAKLVTASTPIFITSAASKTVRSQDSLVIKGSGLAKSATLSISSPASKFALKSGKNGTLTTDATGSIDTVAYIYYTPAVGDTDDGLDKNASFTITDGTNTETVSTALIGRHLPANFVIAAKSGDNWYALPADNAKGKPSPVEITVDDDNDPTTATTFEANVYTLHQQTSTVINGGNGQCVKLAMHGQDNAPLFGGKSDNELGKSGSSLVTSDLSAPNWWYFKQTNTSITNAEDAKYYLHTANTANPVTLYNDAEKWGLYASGPKNVQEIRILTWVCLDPAAPTIGGTQTYTTGETITLTASHDGSNHDAYTTYTWYKGATWDAASAADPVQDAATGSSGYTLTIASCTTDDAGTYWCEASNGTCSAHNSSGYAITVSEASCTPQSIVKTQLTSVNAGTTTGYNDGQYAGDPVIATFQTTPIDGGYKMTGSAKLFVTIKGGFVADDKINIVITKASDLTNTTNKLLIFYNASSPALLTTIDADKAGTYTYTLTASDITTLGSNKTIGVFRSSGETESNPYVKSVEVEGCREWATCTAPDAIVAGSVTGEGATFTITDAENTNNYEIYYSTSSTAPTAETSATISGISSKNRAVTGLTASTTYYYWVRSNCGGATKSSWVAGTPTSFTTSAAAATHSVTYNGNENTGGSVPTDDTAYEEGDIVTVKGNTGSLVKTGQTFLGWSTSATASSGTFYPAGYKFYMPNEDVTLYAVWGSTGCETLVNVAANSSTTVSATVGSGTVNSPSSQAYAGAIKLNSSGYIELTPKAGSSFAAGNKITITMYCGADASKTIGFRLADKDDGNSMSASVAKRTEKTFEYTIVSGDITSGKIKIYRYGSESWFVSAIVEDCSGGGATGHTVSFNMNGYGSAIADIENVPSGSKIGAPVASPTAVGVEFGGWYREAGCTNAWNFGSSTISKDTTLYAKWTTCAPSISGHPSGDTYTQDAAATALSVTAIGEGLNYQWYTSENGSADIQGSSAIPGATSASYTPSTSLLGTIYYFCVVSNTCGNAVSNKAAITVNDSKPAPTANWDIEVPKEGGKGFTFSIEVNKNNGDNWDGELLASMLTLSDNAILDGASIVVNNTDKTISGTYGVKAGSSSPVTFYLLLPATATQSATRLDHDRTFTPCAGGGVGDSYNVRVRKNYEKDASNNYRWVTPGAGEITYAVGSSISSAKAASIVASVFDSIMPNDKQYVWVKTYEANTKTIRLYVETSGANVSVNTLYKNTVYATAADKDIVSSDDYSVSYDGSGSAENTGAKGTHYMDITFDSPLAANDIICVKFSSSKVRAYGAILTTVGDGGDQTTSLAWNTPSPSTPVTKNEDAADFSFTANRSNTEAQKSLGEISYSSSNTAVATVNATTGLVHIADAIDFGAADYKEVTITATLAASGCYKKASITYTLRVNKYVCTEAAGTVSIKTDVSCSEKVLTVTGFEAGATFQWQKDGVDIPSATSQDYTATTSGEYSVVTTKTCAVASTNSIKLSIASATASKIVDSWYVKNGRRTPDIALVQTTGATSFTVTSGGTITEIGGCTFELKDDGIIYLHGQKEDGSAPSDMTAGDMTITITVSGCTGALSGLNITIHKQAETPKPSVAFVVDGTKRAEGGTATSVLEAKTSERPIWKYLANSFTLTGCNAYWSVDSKELRQYYSQFDAILITDDPSTDTKGTGGVSYVKAFGTMVDVRPILTLEAFVGKFKDGGWHVYDATPTSPNPRQVEMKLECKNHDIFKGLDPETSDNVRVTRDEYDNEYWHVIMVDTTVAPYHNTSKDYKTLPALQGFDPHKFDHMLGVGTIADETLQGGVERQEEPAARMMILGIQNEAMAALTNEGKLIVKNAIEYLLKTNMEDVNDCSNYFTGGPSGTGDNWATPENWSSGKVPDFETRVRILRPVVISGDTKAIVARVDIATSGTSKWVDGECTGSVTVNPRGALIVSGKIRRAEAPRFGIDDLMPTENDDLIVKAATDAPHRQGALIFDNSDGDTHAVVEMWNPSYWEVVDGKKKKYWSYVAVPIQEADIPNFFWHGFTYLYDETSGWIKKGDGTSLYPFQGIGASLQDGNMETFYGPLATTESQDITLTYTADKGKGMNLIGNSWTAPIQIANFEEDDFGDAAAEVWVFNTGHTNDGHSTMEDGSAGTTTAGQWQTIPIGVAGLPGYTGLKVIPAMQAFEVNTESETTLHLDYDRLVRAGRENLNEPMRAPRRSAAKQIEATMRVRVSGESTHTDVYLLKDARFSDAFDNGWDGHYLSGDDRSAQLYAISEEEGKLAFLAQPEIEGTQLGFAPSKEGNEYTFSFSYDGDEEYYLNDIKLKTSTLISEEATYSFTYGDGDTNRFYISRTPIDAPQTSTGVDNTGSGEVKARKFIYRDKMYIMINGRVYSADGALVK